MAVAARRPRAPRDVVRVPRLQPPPPPRKMAPGHARGPCARPACLRRWSQGRPARRGSRHRLRATHSCGAGRLSCSCAGQLTGTGHTVWERGAVRTPWRARTAPRLGLGARTRAVSVRPRPRGVSGGAGCSGGGVPWGRGAHRRHGAVARVDHPQEAPLSMAELGQHFLDGLRSRPRLAGHARARRLPRTRQSVRGLAACERGFHA